MSKIKTLFKKENLKFIPAVVIIAPLIVTGLMILNILLLLNAVIASLGWLLPNARNEDIGRTTEVWKQFWNKGIWVYSGFLEDREME
jgi:hypothetical protein